MTSREIANLVEIRHDNVRRTIETLAAKSSISHPQIEGGAKSANGVAEKVYIVGKRDSYVIVAQLSPIFTAKLVDRWQELEAGQSPALPQSYHEALLALTEEVGKRIALESQAAIDAPKVEFAMAVRNMDGSCQLGEFAKAIGWGRNRLFKKLREDGVLMVTNIPYQSHIDRELFVVIEGLPYTDRGGKTHPIFTTHVTGKGQVWMEKKYRVEAK